MKRTLLIISALALMCIGVRAQNLKATVNGAPIEMIEVEGGTFMMGDHMEQRADALPLHEVSLDTYYIGRTEVTQQLWTAVMGYNNSYFKGKYRPVETIDYDEVQAFIIKLNKLTGINFRLLTEAEWEYAARGGNKSKGYIYSGSNDLDEVGWIVYNNVINATHNVANKAPNELGIYDMTGNVWEWCSDYNGAYTSEPQKNPTGPTWQSWHQARGGAFHNNAESNEVCYRDRLYPSKKRFTLGFRLAMDATKDNIKKMVKAKTWDLTEDVVAEETPHNQKLNKTMIDNPTVQDLAGVWQYISFDANGKRKYHVALKFLNADGTFQNLQFSQSGNGQIMYKGAGTWKLKDGCIVQKYEKGYNNEFFDGKTITIKLMLGDNGNLMHLLWVDPMHGGKVAEWYEKVD